MTTEELRRWAIERAICTGAPAGSVTRLARDFEAFVRAEAGPARVPAGFGRARTGASADWQDMLPGADVDA